MWILIFLSFYFFLGFMLNVTDLTTSIKCWWNLGKFTFHKIPSSLISWNIMQTLFETKKKNLPYTVLHSTLNTKRIWKNFDFLNTYRSSFTARQTRNKKKYVLDSSTDIFKQNMTTFYLTWVVDNRPCLCFLLLSWLAAIFDSPFPFCPRS